MAPAREYSNPPCLGTCQAGRMRISIDVYGRFVAHAELSADGEWALFRVAGEGKRRRITDVVVPAHASRDDVIDMLEAAYHEGGTPDTDITILD